MKAKKEKLLFQNVILKSAKLLHSKQCMCFIL